MIRYLVAGVVGFASGILSIALMLVWSVRLEEKTEAWKVCQKCAQGYMVVYEDRLECNQCGTEVPR